MKKANHKKRTTSFNLLPQWLLHVSGTSDAMVSTVPLLPSVVSADGNGSGWACPESCGS